MTLGLIFNHFFAKTHFGAFSVFHPKYAVIFEDKKIQTQKWCITEKSLTTEVRENKMLFIPKVASDFDFNHFLEKLLQCHQQP